MTIFLADYVTHTLFELCGGLPVTDFTDSYISNHGPKGSCRPGWNGSVLQISVIRIDIGEFTWEKLWSRSTIPLSRYWLTI